MFLAPHQLASLGTSMACLSLSVLLLDMLGLRDTQSETVLQRQLIFTFADAVSAFG